jgi:glycosyltransferase involved in cell wall biosynthesis
MRLRVHPPPRAFRRALPRPALVAGTLRALGRRPASTLRELRPASGGATRYRRAVLLALEPAIVHFCSLAAAQQYPGVAVNARVLVSVVDQDIEAFAVDERRVLDGLAGGADAFHVESDSAAELVAGATERPVVVIPPACDESLLAMPSREHRAGGALRILSIGGLTWAEGYEYALEAVALLAKRGVPCEYRIVGSGAYADAVAFARWQLGVERLVEVVGAGDRSTLREHLAWADVFVSAAVAPRSPRALLDARAAGLPVVRTAQPPLSADPLAVPRRDPEALADALASVAYDPALRAALAKAGREAAASAVRADARLTRFLGLYEQLLAASR